MANIKKEKETKLFSLWLEIETINKLKDVGKRQDRTVAYLIKKAIDKTYNKDK